MKTWSIFGRLNKPVKHSQTLKQIPIYTPTQIHTYIFTCIHVPETNIYKNYLTT